MLKYFLPCCYLLIVAITQNVDEINYGNLYRYMSLPPSDLNRLLDLLQQPQFTRALVSGDEALKKNPLAPPPNYTGKEDEQQLIYYLLGYTSGPHEPYKGGFADHKGTANRKGFERPRTLNSVYKLRRGEEGFSGFTK